MRTLLVWCILLYLRFWARLALSVQRPVVIGIAGSVGKTSTKQALYAITSGWGRTVVTKGNSETGVPLGILGIPLTGYGLLNWIVALVRAPFGVFHLLGAKFLIVEMGIDGPDAPKNMAYLLSIIAPDIAVFVTESAAHTEAFEKTLSASERQLAADAKLELLIQRIADEDMRMATHALCKTVIYNADNAYLVKTARGLSGKRVLTFGKDPSNDLVFADHKISLEASSFSFRVNGESLSITIRKQALPREYREVFAAALLAGRAAGFSYETMVERIETKLELPKGRSSLLEGIRGTMIIDSSYNASKASVLAFLDMAAHLKQKTGRRLVVCIGDMRELGEEAVIEHQTVAERLAVVADEVYGVGALIKQHVIPRVELEGVPVQWFENSLKLGEHLRAHVPDNALVLMKGSQNTIYLEEAIKQILAHPSDSRKLCRQEPYWKKF